MNSILRNHRKNSLLLLLALIAGLGLMVVAQVTAQTLTILHSFSAVSDGSDPSGALFLSGKTLFGATINPDYVPGEGFMGGDVVFAVNTDGSGFREVNTINAASFESGVILCGNTIYGTGYTGGTNGHGFVFAANTSGSDLTNLYSFTAFGQGSDTNSDGAGPLAGLILLDSTLYGTTLEGGLFDNGTVFAINTDGSGFVNIHSFAGVDGAFPYGGLVSSGNTLYGTTSEGGSNGYGTVFAISSDGLVLSNLYNFTATSNRTNGEGAFPESSLILSGNTLYGTASAGGIGGNGTVFAIKTDGTGFTNLHNFSTGRNVNMYAISNSDGAMPEAGLILSGHTLYGTTTTGGPTTAGTIFSLNIDGTAFTNLYLFPGGSGAGYPSGGLLLSANRLYGTTGGGGSYGHGTVFGLSLPAPQLTIAASGTNAILTWPTNVAGFDYTGYTLQATTNLVSPSWSAVSPPPVIVNGLETVINAISGTQMFYRLMQ